jgi:hypothetical protein
MDDRREEMGREISLSAEQVRRLERILRQRPEATRLAGIARPSPPPGAQIQIRRSDVEALRGALTEILAKEGFDANYAPNSLGREIESLIDLLGS